MKRMVMGVALMVMMAAGSARSTRAEVKPAGAGGGFRIEQEYLLPATPNEVFDAATGDISGWWDHSFSDHPKRLYIEAKPGGGFYEIFDDAGNGALHATVIYADRGKRLRFTGPLGLSGKAVDCVTTYDLSAEKMADATAKAVTKLKLTVTMSGEIDEATAKIVDGVWHHFLGERFKTYIESGEYKKHGAVAPAGRMQFVPVKAEQTGADTARAMVATIADVSWLTGSWTGVAGTGTTEEACSAPADGAMMCMFRAMNLGKTQGLEFITLRETPQGIEERARFFASDLAEDKGDEGVFLKMVSLSPTRIVFDNAKQTGLVKHITINRAGNDEFTTHIELVDAGGKSSFIDSEWKRAK